MSTLPEEHNRYRAAFVADLARLIGCEPDALPAHATIDVAASFLGLSNSRTLITWKSQGRHGIAVVKIGRTVYPLTDWLLDMKLRGLSIAKDAA